MTGYLRGVPKTQVTEILYDQRVFEEDEIKKALDDYRENNPEKKKKGKKK